SSRLVPSSYSWDRAQLARSIGFRLNRRTTVAAMYNGIGLQTARGSGTNGHVQTNKFFI
uniref:Uncharacterized protein n=1 Tax=Aegilops tauschii subsp. strangulata TaxID=200361 RepID=A0A453MC10_AEGTS